VIHHIDVSTVLRRAVCDLYSNLVTRPTGAAVRTEIEQLLAANPGRMLTIIDFTHVGLLDFSCADEIVAKLLLRFVGEGAEEDYFLFRGVGEHHLEAIETVLERHGLALVLEDAAGRPCLVGEVSDAQREAWEAVVRLRRAEAGDLARVLGVAPDEAEARLGALSRRRLVMRLAGAYVPVGIQ
jgi:hypothetical protein